MRKMTFFWTVAVVMVLSFIPVRAQAETLEEAKERIRQEVIDEYGPAPAKQQPAQFRAVSTQEKKQVKALPKKSQKQPAQKSPMDMSLPFGVSLEAALRMIMVMMFFAIIPAVIAKLKGRSFIAWWVLGTLFFIFTLPIAVFMRSTRQPRTAKPDKAAQRSQEPQPREPDKTALDDKQPKKTGKPSIEKSNEAVDIYATIEKLAELKAKGVISEEEFKSKKNELLARI